jgi:DNA-binding transcriptional LysR family regulator
MVKKIDWERQLGRRLKLRDLHIFFTVVQLGSMAKAASQLGVSQPTVSEVIADLEHTYGVRLFDRRPQGVTLTIYGSALLKRGAAAFDELKQSGRDIEFLTDPNTGEITIGSVESITATLLPAAIRRFSENFPRVVLKVDTVSTAGNFEGLRERRYDFFLSRPMQSYQSEIYGDDLDVEFVFDDPLVVVAGSSNPLTRRRKIHLADLMDEPWIVPPPETFYYHRVVDAFRAFGLAMPEGSLVTLSVQLRTNLLAGGRYLTAVPNSLLALNVGAASLKRLQIDLPVPPFAVTVVTLKNRTLSPVVERFIECIRETARAIAGPPPDDKTKGRNAGLGLHRPRR